MKQADWTKWSAVAEALSTIAIVATLLYLAIQTQQNSEAIRASVRQATLASDLQLISDTVNNPSVIEAMSKETISLTEMTQLQNWLIGLVRSREHQWFQYQDGLLDEPMWQSYLTGLAANLSTPRTRAWWEDRGHAWFDSEFADMVTGYLAGVPLTDGTHTFERIELLQNPE